MPFHKDLTGADLHEPKGQASAAINTVYVADGSGSGTHKKLQTSSLDMSNMESPNSYYLAAVIDDISTASSVLVPILEGSTFVSAILILGGAITTADANVSFTRDDASSFGSDLTVLYSGSAEGSTFTFTPTANQDISGGGYVKIGTDGGSTGTVPAYLCLKLSRKF